MFAVVTGLFFGAGAHALSEANHFPWLSGVLVGAIAASFVFSLCAFDSIATPLARLGGTIPIMLLAVAVGAAVGVLSRFYGLADWLPGLDGLVVDAIVGALATSLTLVLATIFIQIDYLGQAAADGASDAIAAGLVGDLSIPDLAQRVRAIMDPLPYLTTDPTSAYFILKHTDAFREEVAKRALDMSRRGTALERVALGLMSGVKYEETNFLEAVKILKENFPRVFRHIVVLTGGNDRPENISAAIQVHDNSGLRTSLAIEEYDILKNVLLLVHGGGEKRLDFIGFAIFAFPVGNTARQLLSQFVSTQASSALLHFGGRAKTVMGMIHLWQLVSLSISVAEHDRNAPTAETAQSREVAGG